MKPTTFSLLLLSLCLVTRAGAQDLQELLQQFGGRLPPGVQVQGGAGPPGDAKPGGGDSKKASERAKELKKLTFDRRSSAILKAWSKPPEPEKKPEQSEKEEDADTPPEELPEASVDSVEDESPPLSPEEQAEADKKAEAEAEAKTKAEAAKEEARKKEEQKKALQVELKKFQRNVTLGLWDEVKTYLTQLDEAEGKAGYEQLIRSLQSGPKGTPKNAQKARYAEKNVFTPQDVVALVDAAPAEIEDDLFLLLGQILRQCLDSGNDLQSWVALMRAGLDSESFPMTRRQVARLLFGANHAVEAGEFLPQPDQAVEANDREALNLLSRHFLAMAAKKKGTGSSYLEQAWTVTQAALAAGEVEQKAKQEALKRAVELAPKLREELGQSWLDESFTERPERGMEILATIGSAASRALQTHAKDADFRLKGLELQTTAANALLKAAPEKAEQWSPQLELLASNWLNEAQLTYLVDQSTSRGPSLRRDSYGNYFYYQSNRRNKPSNTPDAIPTGKLLDIRPEPAWLERVGDSLAPRFRTLFAQLHLKLGEESDAFPFIEELAATHPEQARELVHEFLRVWMQNHNPNSSSGRTNQYMFIFGFDRRANGIPLTRSRQERNLKGLSEWVARLRALPIEDIDEELLAQCFTTAHSSAEVYRLETIESVFGSIADLEPKTLARMIQKMRSNLVGVWRDPATQKDKQTKRRSRDIQNEVFRGYAVARSVAEQGLEKHPEEWPLVLAWASLNHDENNYRQEVKQDPEFSGRRKASFELFAEAARIYATRVGDMEQEQQSSEVYETWFYAALGACDLNAIDHEKQLAQDQLTHIRSGLESLGTELADHHLALFANSLFTRMSSVNPAVKFRYLRAGLEIVGDHERAREAVEIYDYYQDLVTEIELLARVDGRDVVGHEQPFGLFVELRHTREIERESGGFGKYLVNQNSQSFSWNYGRPTEDYRDKFEESTREALQEHFDILSITFNHPDVHSRAEPEYGWRSTPYAYILLKPLGPQVDRIPPLRLDMDFLDTSGYALIPIESSPVMIDSAGGQGEARPFTDLRVTQTLDERQAASGKLVVEIKATALGLVPPLDAFLDLAPEGFQVVETEDQGVSVSEFDKESEQPAVLTERTWMVTLNGRADLEQLPTEFRFGRSLVDDAEMEYQRFVDADLELVEATIALESSYGETTGTRIWMLAPLLLAVLALGLWLWRSRRRTVGVTESRFRMPGSITPFTAIGLLRDIERNNGSGGLDGAHAKELSRQIEHLEQHYFVDGARKEELDLEHIVQSWLNRL